MNAALKPIESFLSNWFCKEIVTWSGKHPIKFAISVLFEGALFIEVLGVLWPTTGIEWELLDLVLLDVRLS